MMHSTIITNNLIVVESKGHTSRELSSQVSERLSTMGNPITATPVHKMDCNIPDCQKQKKDGYKTKVGLTNHMKKWHQVAKDVLSPITTTARTLFKNVEDESGDSTQGNSRGEVNIVKVVSAGIYLCGICGKNYQTKKEMDEHMEHHDTSKGTDKPTDDGDLEDLEEESMLEPNEDQENEKITKEIENLVIVDNIVDSFVDTAFRAMRPNEAPETTEMEDKYNLLYRQHQKLNDRHIVMTKANENKLEVLKEMEKLRVVAKSSIEDVQETKKTNQVLEECLKMKDTEIEAMEEIISKLKKNAVEDAGKAMDQAKNIRALEEELGVWDVEEEETGLDNEWISDEARRHNKTHVKCKKCDYETNVPSMMDGHMTKHNAYGCTMCKKKCKTQADLNLHAQREHRPDLMNCTKCNKQFTAKNALSQHMNSQHPKNPPVGHSQWAQQKNKSFDYSCTNCNSGFEYLNELREHKKTKHNGQNQNGIVTSAGIPCRYFAQGRCNREQCQFSHEMQQQQNQREWVPECSRGQQCQFFAQGTCNFFHKGVGVQQSKKQHNQQKSQKKCHFQDRCWNQNCNFMHEDFGMGIQFQENY